MFWKYVRRRMKYRTSIPELELEDASIFTNGNEKKAEVLSKYFASVFTQEPEKELHHLSAHCQSKLEECNVDDEIIKKRLRKINISKSSGPDQIHPRILRKLSDISNIPLSIIISSSLHTGTLPSDWKNAHISAIYKKGSK